MNALLIVKLIEIFEKNLGNADKEWESIVNIALMINVILNKHIGYSLSWHGLSFIDRYDNKARKIIID